MLIRVERTGTGELARSPCCNYDVLSSTCSCSKVTMYCSICYKEIEAL